VFLREKQTREDVAGSGMQEFIGHVWGFGLSNELNGGSIN
jgi:hypothetical protein